MYKRIGIDIDNTITKLEPTLWELARYYEKLVPTVDTITDYNLSSVFGISESDSKSFWSDREFALCAEAEINEDMVDNIFRNFTDNNTEIYIITNRDIKFYDVTKKWLKRHSIPHKKLIMTSGVSKKQVLKDYGIELMIDDKPLLFEEMNEDKESTDTVMVCVDYPYNKNSPCDIRVDREGLRMANNYYKMEC